MPPSDLPDTRARVLEALRNVLDPELGVNVLDLGLVYDVALAGDDHVRIDLTMTSPACPLGDVLIADVERTVRRLVPAAGRIDVRLVWEPPWTAERMSDAARRQLGW
jgi:metal-sulfur cluster biosynthetic enzyme